MARAVNPTSAVNTTTSAYLDQGKVNLRQFIRGGGGFVAIHNAFGTEYNWPWYEGLLGQRQLLQPRHVPERHDQHRRLGRLVDGRPAGDVPFKDEWYNLVPYPTKVKFLATVDETTLATLSNQHPGHGSFHPVAWCQYYDGGRAWLTTLGHDVQAFQDGSGSPGPGRVQEAHRARHQVGDGPDAFLPVVQLQG